MKATEFVSALVMHFPVRHESEAREVEWMRSMIDAVKAYDGSVLQRAAARIIDTRTDRRFPLPAEIRKICYEIADDDRRHRLPVDHSDKQRSPIWSRERQELADQMIRTNLGRTAAREGWILGLWHFCVQHSRLPHDHETGSLKAEAARLPGSVQKCLDSGSLIGVSLAELGQNMLKRRDELARSVLGESRQG